MVDIPKSTPILQFDATLSDNELAKIRDNLSAVVLQGAFVWLGGDEGTRIHRMTRDQCGGFGLHRQFELKDLLNLPGPVKEEIDIEGLDADGGYLWLIGSHSAKRKKAEGEKSPAENLNRLARLEAEGNRFTLARVPLDANAEPVVEHYGLVAARLKGDATGNLLTEALRSDPHLGYFVPRVLPNESVKGIPSKDNGFDIEGLAVSGNRVFVGLRGPVLRGWAIVLELRVRPTGDGVLELDPLGALGEPYLKHFLQLDGLGVRDIAIHGNDLLVLAGPSMDLDGPVFIYRWEGALNTGEESLTWNKDLTKVISVPFGVNKDHAEGLAIVTDTPLTVLVCYDSPDEKTRIDGEDEHGVKADLFEVPR